MDNKKSLDKFRSLVEKDLTGLADYWGCLPSYQGTLIIESLLLEHSNKTIKAWTGKKDSWSLVHSLVSLLEMWAKYTPPGLEEVRALQAQYEHHVSRPCTACERKALSRLAGWGDSGPGAIALWGRDDLASIGSWKGYAGKLRDFVTIEGHSNWWSVASDRHLMYLSHKARQQYTATGAMRSYSREQFVSMCSDVFLGGERTGTVRRKFLSKERARVADHMRRHGSQSVRRIRSNMTRVQAYVLDRFLCAAPDPESSIQRDLRPEVRAAAKDVCMVLDGWVPRQQTPPRHLPGWQRVFYRFNSAEETLSFLQASGKPGRRPSIESGRLLFEPIGDFPARLQLLESNGGFVPDAFHGPSNSYHTRGSLRLRADRVPEMQAVASRKQCLSLRQRVGLRSGQPSMVSVTRSDIEKFGKFLSDKDVVLLSEVMVQGRLQSAVARDLGITQSAVSHRLARALDRLHLSKSLLPLPSGGAYIELGNLLCPGDSDGATWASALLDAHVTCLGKQTDSARMLGVSQPKVCQDFNTLSRHILRDMGSWRLSSSAKRACKVIETLLTVPYAFQSVKASRFPWRRKVLAEKLAAHKVSIKKGPVNK